MAERCLVRVRVRVRVRVGARARVRARARAARGVPLDAGRAHKVGRRHQRQAQDTAAHL